MISANVLCQRWRAGRCSYRRPDEPIDTRRYEVAPIGHDAALTFVQAHHYSGTYPSARARFGLFRGEQLVGVAVFSVGGGPAVLAILPDAHTAVELGRFVLLDDVPANGETFFLARCFEQLRVSGFTGVVSFSDDVPRRDGAGAVVFRGHVGTIYQAHNAIYTGRATPRTKHLLPDGREFNERAAQKIRAREQGWHYAAEQLIAAGAAPLGEHDDSRVWLRTWLPRVTRAFRHPGCHRYVWGLDRATKRALPGHLGRREITAAAYPKRLAN